RSALTVFQGRRRNDSPWKSRGGAAGGSRRRLAGIRRNRHSRRTQRRTTGCSAHAGRVTDSGHSEQAHSERPAEPVHASARKLCEGRGLACAGDWQDGPAPPQTDRHRATRQSMIQPSTKTLIDCHVHLAALPEGDNGCYISPKMLKSPLFRFLFWKHKLSPDQPREANQKYAHDLLTELRASRNVQQAVLLGMDGVYDSNGMLDRPHTDFLISNEYVLRTVEAHPDEFLAGVSINPQRRDAIDEVHRVADAGAVLVKVLPNAQQFNPA